MKKTIAAIALTVFSSMALASETSYKWDTVTKRIDGTNTQHKIEYVVTHNNVDYPINTNYIVLSGHPESGTSSCVYAIEIYPEGLRMRGDSSCVTINAKPSTPKFEMIQMINFSKP
jgi:hypothetical protein